MFGAIQIVDIYFSFNAIEDIVVFIIDNFSVVENFSLNIDIHDFHTINFKSDHTFHEILKRFWIQSHDVSFGNTPQ